MKTVPSDAGDNEQNAQKEIPSGVRNFHESHLVVNQVLYPWMEEPFCFTGSRKSRTVVVIIIWWFK